VISNNQIKQYKKDMKFSYTLGAFPTYELIKAKHDKVNKVFAHSRYSDYDNLQKICLQYDIDLEINDKIISKISSKENCFVVGVFEKYSCDLDKDKAHIVLVNPNSMGNVGTIIRTAIGFGIKNIAIIEPAADIFNPKTIRASMGALFKINYKKYNDFSNYQKEFPEHEIFTFMLNANKSLDLKDMKKVDMYSLVFGNEATGLDDSFLDIGTSIFIPQTKEVDSLNITIAAGIGMYVFINTHL